MTDLFQTLSVTREMQLERSKEPASRDARIATMVRHMEAERDNDFETLATTISPDPRFNLHPIGSWTGWESVMRMYAANFPFAEAGPLEMIKGASDPRVALWGEDHVLFHMATYPDDYPGHRNLTILVKFDGNLFHGETVFLTDARLIAAMRHSVRDLNTDLLPGFSAFSQD